MSDSSFTTQYKDEITSAALGYGYGIINCTSAVLWIKAVAERDVPLLAVMLLTSIPVSGCYKAMTDFIELLGKEDGEKLKRFESVFRTATLISFLQFLVMFKLFLLG